MRPWGNGLSKKQQERGGTLPGLKRTASSGGSSSDRKNAEPEPSPHHIGDWLGEKWNIVIRKNAKTGALKIMRRVDQ